MTPSATGKRPVPFASTVRAGRAQGMIGAVTAVLDDARENTRARIEQAALDLFTRLRFENVTTDEVADAAGISRRTFFRYFATKADAVWGDFGAHVDRLAGLLAAAPDDQPVLTSICAAYVEVNDYAAGDLPMLRQRLRLILTEPALRAHAQVRYNEVDRVVAEHVARRTGLRPDALVPRLVATSTRAAATTAFEVWLADERLPLARALHDSFDELAGGFPAVRTTPPGPRPTSPVRAQSRRVAPARRPAADGRG